VRDAEVREVGETPFVQDYVLYIQVCSYAVMQVCRYQASGVRLWAGCRVVGRL
jgi:hypothetical protein